jgi:DNA primase
LTPLGKQQRELLEQATRQYQEDLLEAPWAIEYLKSRGIDQRMAEEFRLGAVINPPDGFERFRGMVSLPNISAAEDGHVTGIKFRDLNPDTKQKYDQPSGQEARLFNLRALKAAQELGTIYLTEGEFDAIVVSSLGLPAVAIPGADSFAPKGAKYRFRIFDGLHVVLVKDSDPSGDKLANLLLRELPDIEVLDPSPAKDVNELWLKLNQDEEEMYLWLTGQI